MNRRIVGLTVVLCVMAFAPVNAQPPSKPGALNSQIYEDIEVLGRILDRALNLPRYSTVTVPVTIPHSGGFGGGFGGGQGLGMGGLGAGGMGFSGMGQGLGNLGGGGQDGFSGGGLRYTSTAPVSVPAYGPAQGTYVKGHGVIYTIVLPPPKHDSKPTPPLPPTQSEWDRVRKQIRGENPPSGSGTSSKPKEPSVADTVLEVLAKNGHHFSQLGEQENLTVSIIFRTPELPRQSRWRVRGAPADINAVHPSDLFDPVDINAVYPDAVFESQNVQPEPSPAANGQGSSEKKKLAAATGGGDSTEKSSPEDYELLGDLHLKQGQGLEALHAYKQALDKSPDAQHAAVICLKMAQLFLTVQKDEAAARRAMERARELLAQAAPAADKSAPRPTAATGVAEPLPSRLMISAPKRLLDQVGASKITLEDFKKKATVERLSFSVPQK